MAKDKEVMKVGTPNQQLVTAPAFMAEAPAGDELLKQFVIPPRLKVVQKQADPLLLEQFGEGDVILVPARTLVAEMPRDGKGKPQPEDMEPFYVIPVFFFPEWCKWSPIALRGQAPAIMERSTDPRSPLAQKSRSRELRYEAIPEKPELKYRHVEHLNFVSMLMRDGQPFGDPFIASFSRGEHGSGRRWAGLIRMRRAPLYGCVFEVHVGLRQNAQGSWWGLDVTNPPSSISPWVSKEPFEALKGVYVEMAKLHKDATLQAAYEDESEEATDDPEDADQV